MITDVAPEREGAVVRDGVRIAYQVFGDGPRVLLLLPTWTIVHSDFWKRQVPHFAPKYTVVTFDGRGNGASDRPADPNAYAIEEGVDDALAVLDELGIERVALLAVSAGADWAALLAADYPERISAAAFIGSSLALGPNTPERVAAEESFDDVRAFYDGWGRWNRHAWREDWPGFLEFFFGQCFTEPNSRAFIDHFVAMGLETTPDVVAMTLNVEQLEGDRARAVAARITCPTLVIHGTADAIAPLEWGVELAAITDAELHALPDAGHEPQLRWADQTNTIVDAFLARVWPRRLDG